MAATRVGNVIKLTAVGDSLNDIYSSAAAAGARVFSRMIVTGDAATNSVTFETDDGALDEFMKLNWTNHCSCSEISGPLTFPRSLQVKAITGTNAAVYLIEGV